MQSGRSLHIDQSTLPVGKGAPSESPGSLQEETLDPKLAKAPDTKEGLYFGREVPEDDPEAQTVPLTGPNQWPSEVCSAHRHKQDCNWSA